MANTENKNINTETIDFAFRTNGAVKLVQLTKKNIGKPEDNQFYYEAFFTNGKEMLQITGGKLLADLELFKDYELGLNFVNGKLKIVTYRIV